MIRFPRLGSSRHGRANVFSIPLKEDYARAVGVPFEEASFVIDALGAVMQERLLRGLPSGIPFVGVVYVHFTRNRIFTIKGISNQKHFPKDLRGKDTITYPVFSRPALNVSREICIAIKDNAPYTGALDDMYHKSLPHSEEINALERTRRKSKREREASYVKKEK